tara:strand:+ start:259 stop:486 length:228 start_codon:yes stop_codon:yes gene_type:complete
MENNCLLSTYTVYTTFKTEYNLQEVHNYWVKYGTLYVVPKKGDEPIAYEGDTDLESVDFKRPTAIEIVNETDAGF